MPNTCFAANGGAALGAGPPSLATPLPLVGAAAQLRLAATGADSAQGTSHLPRSKGGVHWTAVDKGEGVKQP